ncbi:MAG: hypothetical protein Q8R92_01715 [Deltaproteobacteria bacterium]|nr:hypothetical protein [Deltaproteobacteria bacterium]
MASLTEDKGLLYGRIYTLLRTYRCQNTIDEDGNPLELVDVLTPEGSGSIAPGEEEIELLADALWTDVVAEIGAAGKGAPPCPK